MHKITFRPEREVVRAGKSVVQKTPFPEMSLPDLKALLGFVLPEIQRAKGIETRHFVNDNLPDEKAKIKGGEVIEVWIERHDSDLRTLEEKPPQKLLVVNGVLKIGFRGARRVEIRALSSKDQMLLENAWKKLFSESSRT